MLATIPKCLLSVANLASLLNPKTYVNKLHIQHRKVVTRVTTLSTILGLGVCFTLSHRVSSCQMYQLSANKVLKSRRMTRNRTLSPAGVPPCLPTGWEPAFTQQSQSSEEEKEIPIQVESQGLSQAPSTPPLGQPSPQSLSALGLAPPQSPPTPIDLDLSPILVTSSPEGRYHSPPTQVRNHGAPVPLAPKRVLMMNPMRSAPVQDLHRSNLLETEKFSQTWTPLSPTRTTAMKKTFLPSRLVSTDMEEEEEEGVSFRNLVLGTGLDGADPLFDQEYTSVEDVVPTAVRTSSTASGASSAQRGPETTALTARRSLLQALAMMNRIPPEFEETGTTTQNQTTHNQSLNQVNSNLQPRELVLESPLTDPPNSRASRGVRWNAKQFLLTFSRNNTEKQTVADRAIQAYGDNIDWMMVAEEVHQDGCPHLHVALKFKKRMDVRQHNFFDFMSNNELEGGSNHCNIEIFNSPAGTVEYLSKWDPEPVRHGEIPERKKKTTSSRGGNSSSEGKPRKPKITQTIHQYFKAGKTLQDIDKEEELGPFLMCNLAKLRDYQSWQQVQAAKLRGPGDAVEFRTACTRTPCQKVVEWLEKNLNQPRRFKQKQLYIHGPPNTGKTTLLEKLRHHYRVFEMPADDKRFNDWEDGAYDIAVMDEFKGQLPITFLNKFLDGQTMKLAALYSVGIQKKQNIPMIICSNFTVENAYHNSSHEALHPLQIRLEIVELEPEHILDVDFITHSKEAEDDHGEQSSMHLDNEE